MTDAFRPRPAGARLNALYWRIALSICVCCGLWLGFPNDFLVFPPLALLWPVGIALLGFTASTAKSSFLWGWLSMSAGSMATLYWLSFPVHYVGSLPWPLAGACALLIVACLGWQGGFFALACHFCRLSGPWLKTLFAVLVWYLLEWSFAIALGFPWLQLSGAFAPWPAMVQTADIVGAWLSGCIWLGACLLLVLAFPSIAQNDKSKNFLSAPFAAGVVIVVFLVVHGMTCLKNTPYERNPTGPGSIGAVFVEGNIDQNQKWIPAFQLYSLRQYCNLTAEGVLAASKAGYEHPLIIWPETALPFFFEKREELGRQVRQCAIDADCPLLFGAPGTAKIPGLPEDAVFNRAFLLDPSGDLAGFYDKEHLVPFGEYVPPWLNFKFLESLLQGVGIFQEGTHTSPLRYGPLALGMLICYEGIFPWIAGERIAAGANVLVDISNDGWFGKSPASRQHLYLTVLRCIEQNRWLLRGTNTGISAICDTRGRLTMAGPQFRAGYLLGRAKLETEKTVYQQIAPFLPGCVFFGTLVLGCVIFRRSSRRPN